MTVVAISPILEFVEIISLGLTPVYKAHQGYNNRGTGIETEPVGLNNRFTPLPQDRGQPTAFNPGRAYDAFQYLFGPGTPTPGTQVWTLRGRTSSAGEPTKPIVPQFGLVEDLPDGTKRIHLSANNQNAQGVLVQDAMSQISVTLPPPPPVNGPAYFAPGVRDSGDFIDVPAGSQVSWNVNGQVANITV